MVKRRAGSRRAAQGDTIFIQIESKADLKAALTASKAVAGLRNELDATKARATKLLSINNKLNRAYEEQTQKLEDAKNKAGEFGATLVQQDQVILKAISLSEEWGVSIAKTGALLEELIIENQDVTVAIKESAEAMEFWAQRGGRVEDAMREYSNVIKGEGVQAFELYGREGRRVGRMLGEINSKALRARVGTRALKTMMRSASSIFDEAKDTLTVFKIRLETLGINTEVVTRFLKGMVTTVIALGAAISALAVKAIVQYTKSNRLAFKASKRLKDSIKVLVATFASAATGGKKGIEFIDSISKALEDLTKTIHAKREQIFDFFVELGIALSVVGGLAANTAIMLSVPFKIIFGFMSNIGKTFGVLKQFIITAKTAIEFMKSVKAGTGTFDAAKKFGEQVEAMDAAVIAMKDDAKDLFSIPLDTVTQMAKVTMETQKQVIKLRALQAAPGHENVGPIVPKLTDPKDKENKLAKALAAASKTVHKANIEAATDAFDTANKRMLSDLKATIVQMEKDLDGFAQTKLDLMTIRTPDEFGEGGGFPDQSDELGVLDAQLKNSISVWKIYKEVIKEAGEEWDDFTDPNKRLKALTKLRQDFKDKFVGMFEDLTEAVRTFAIDTVHQLAFAFGAGKVSDFGDIIMQTLQTLLTTMAQAVYALAFSMEAIKSGNIFGLLAAGIALSAAAGAISLATAQSSGSSGATTASGGADSLDRLADRLLNEKSDQESQNINVFIGGKQLRNDIVDTVSDAFGFDRSVARPRRAVVR